jgi:WhiB family transcriptional regulator, redox-sensing transcriptional regulator
MTPDEHRLNEIAWRLDRVRWIPLELLGQIVIRHGQCLWAYTQGDAPQLLGIDTADRELAWLLCAGCPVQDECLELELRTAGDQTTGVWGALGEDDRRALYPHWRQRGERADGFPSYADDVDGGQP